MMGMARDAMAPAQRPLLYRSWRWFDRSGILIPLIFLVAMAWLAPISYRGEFDTDEGVNLMKALLVNRGHRLYTEIWSDQPPVLTLLLSLVIRGFGNSVAAGRTLVLLFSALLLWSFFQVVRLSTSRAAAVIGVFLLLFSAWYVRLSIAVMVGLPALALAMLSIYLLMLARFRHRAVFLSTSAVTLALAMQTKLVAGVVAPAMFAYLLLAADGMGSHPRELRQRLVDTAFWSAMLLGCFAVIGLLFGSLDVTQLLQPHLGSDSRSAFAGNNVAAIEDLLVREIGLLPLAAVGIIWAFRARQGDAWLPLGWLLVALAFLLYERPLWYHHVVAFTVPLTWLAAFGVEASLAFVRRSMPIRGVARLSGTRPSEGVLRLAGMALAGAVCLALVCFDPATGRVRIQEELMSLTPSYSEEVAEFIRQGYADQRGWVFTDRPIYAFKAGLPVPPAIAVLTVKRMRSASLSDQEMAGVLQTYRPEVVVLERFRPDYGPAFRSALASRYEPVSTLQTTEVWLPALPPALQDGSGDGFRRQELDDWLTLAVPEGSVPAEVRAGANLRVDGLWWLRDPERPGQALSVSMRLLDRAGQVWSQRDTALGTELVDLRSRLHVQQSLVVPVPEDLPSGDYRLGVVVYDPETGHALTVSTDSAEDEEFASLGSVRVDKSQQGSPASLFAQVPRHSLANFGPVRLLRAETPATIVSPGDAVPVSLTWQANGDFAGEELVVVVQLLDDGDRVVAALEEEPLAGRYPTPRWNPGELVADRHKLSVPPATPPGRYRLVIGLYQAADRARLSTATGIFGLIPREYFTAGVVEVR
jgi:hypothetical protein